TNRLWVRLSLAFLLVAWLAIAAVALIVRSSTSNSFRQYVQERESDTLQGVSAADLEAYYAEHGAWAGVESLLPGPKGQGGSGNGQGAGNGQGGSGGQQGRGASIIIADLDQMIVASNDQTLVGTYLDTGAYPKIIALAVNGEQIGLLVQETPSTVALGEAETDFLSRMTDNLIIAAAGVALLAVLVGAGLAWQVTRPLRKLTVAVEDLKAGQLGRQVAISGSAEINELSEAFNTMSHDLAAGEALRKRMAASIAHELRTPVSVLRGHLEAMLDGVFPLDAQHLAVAYDQTIHLTRLVEDVRLMTRAEAGQLPLKKVSIPAHDLITRAVDQFAPLATDANVDLIADPAAALPLVTVDVDRVQQILSNLLANALRHTPEQGRITVIAQQMDQTIEIRIQNTGSSLTPEQCAHVFDPFWRAEDARARDSGGTGLGLAIVRQLVMLHGGRIWVESDTDPAFTAFVFTLPVGLPA
ncbi:MAG: HAMP domain-containing histidine kinase, partial [Anaerolineae bacterium]|nr:HAMP domain-containing histidine kinase [Anaerolineae bacterium]